MDRVFKPMNLERKRRIIMKSLLVLTLAVFMIAVIPHVYADETGQDIKTSLKKQCVVNYLECKEACDYMDRTPEEQNHCHTGCGEKYTCRPDHKKHKIPSLYDNP